MSPGRWSVARQLLALQAVLLALLIAVTSTNVLLDTRHDAEQHARALVLALAGSLAVSPYVVAAAVAPDPSARLQPYAEQVRRRASVDFVVFMAPDRTRWSHPNPALIGQPFIGTIAPALAGRTFTETSKGTLGRSVRAVAPIELSGRVVGLVAVGVTTANIGKDLRRRLPSLALGIGLAYLVAAAGATLVGRRLRRQTHGMTSEELTRLYEFYDAVLHSVREGVLIVDLAGRAVLVNDEARRLLDLPPAVVGRPLPELPLPAPLAELLRSGRGVTDQLYLTGTRVLVVSQQKAEWKGRLLGAVVTMRDHTELRDLADELSTARALSETLRSQAHEAANRMHTVVSLLELGRSEEAVEFATAELESAQRFTDDVVAAVEEPVLAAVLLGKAAQASERGVELAVTPDSYVGDPSPATPRDLVTILGNLLDNAIEAVADTGRPGRVDVTLRTHGGELVLRVADNGPGLDPEDVANAFTRGWSTKSGTAVHGRGLGLALVGQVVHRLGGRVEVRSVGGAVFTVTLPLRAQMEAEVEHS